MEQAEVVLVLKQVKAAIEGLQVPVIGPLDNQQFRSEKLSPLLGVVEKCEQNLRDLVWQADQETDQDLMVSLVRILGYPDSTGATLLLLKGKLNSLFWVGRNRNYRISGEVLDLTAEANQVIGGLLQKLEDLIEKLES